VILKLRPFSTKLQFHFVDMSQHCEDRRAQSCTSLQCSWGNGHMIFSKFRLYCSYHF